MKLHDDWAVAINDRDEKELAYARATVRELECRIAASKADAARAIECAEEAKAVQNHLNGLTASEQERFIQGMGLANFLEQHRTAKRAVN